MKAIFLPLVALVLLVSWTMGQAPGTPQTLEETLRNQKAESNNLPPVQFNAPRTVQGPTGAADQPQPKAIQPEIKINAEFLEKTFHLKLTRTKRDGADLLLTLEFTKDADDLTALREVFEPLSSPTKPPRIQPIPSGPATPNLPSAPQPEAKFYVLAFDEENVAIAKSRVAGIVGELTGVTGHAIRVVVKDFGKGSEDQVRKVEVWTPRVGGVRAVAGHNYPIPHVATDFAFPSAPSSVPFNEPIGGPKK